MDWMDDDGTARPAKRPAKRRRFGCQVRAKSPLTGTNADNRREEMGT
jgi:hypothetical protein